MGIKEKIESTLESVGLCMEVLYGEVFIRVIEKPDTIVSFSRSEIDDLRSYYSEYKVVLATREQTIAYESVKDSIDNYSIYGLWE